MLPVTLSFGNPRLWFENIILISSDHVETGREGMRIRSKGKVGRVRKGRDVIKSGKR